MNQNMLDRPGPWWPLVAGLAVLLLVGGNSRAQDSVVAVAEIAVTTWEVEAVAEVSNDGKETGEGAGNAPSATYDCRGSDGFSGAGLGEPRDD